MENKNEVTKIEVATEKVADLEKDLNSAANVAATIESAANVDLTKKSKLKAVAEKTFIGIGVMAAGKAVYDILKPETPEEVKAKYDKKLAKAEERVNKKQKKAEEKKKKAERKAAMKEFKKNPNEFLTANADEVEPADVEETEN